LIFEGSRCFSTLRVIYLISGPVYLSLSPTAQTSMELYQRRSRRKVGEYGTAIKTIFDLPRSCDKATRLRSVYGRSFFPHQIPFKLKLPAINISLASPDRHASAPSPSDAQESGRPSVRDAFMRSCVDHVSSGFSGLNGRLADLHTKVCRVFPNRPRSKLQGLYFY